MVDLFHRTFLAVLLCWFSLEVHGESVDKSQVLLHRLKRPGKDGPGLPPRGYERIADSLKLHSTVSNEQLNRQSARRQLMGQDQRFLHEYDDDLSGLVLADLPVSTATVDLFVLKSLYASKDLTWVANATMYTNESLTQYDSDGETVRMILRSMLESSTANLAWEGVAFEDGYSLWVYGKNGTTYTFPVNYSDTATGDLTLELGWPGMACPEYGVSSHCLQAFYTDVYGKPIQPRMYGYNYDARKRTWYQDALEHGSIMFSSPIIWAGVSYYYSAVRLEDIDGNAIGVASVSMSGSILDLSLEEEAELETALSSVDATDVIIYIINEDAPYNLVAASVTGVSFNGTEQIAATRCENEIIAFSAEIVIDIGIFSPTTVLRDGYFITWRVLEYINENVELEDDWIEVIVELANCPAGTYPSEENRICQTCPGETTSLGGSSFCTSCIKGFYWNNVTQTCDSCPSGAKCSGGRQLPRPKEGHWVLRTYTHETDHMRRCHTRNCKGVKSRDDNFTCWDVDYLYDPGCEVDDLQCYDGSTGPLCGACSRHFVFSAFTQRCVPCSSFNLHNPQTFMVSIILCLLTVVCLLAVFLGVVELPEWVISPVYSMASNGKLKVIWSNLQIIASISWALEIPFPEPFPQFLRALAFLQPTELLSSLGCTSPRLSNYRANMIVTSIIPIAVAVVIWLTYYVRIFAVNWSYELAHMVPDLTDLNSGKTVDDVEGQQQEKQVELISTSGEEGKENVIVMPSITTSNQLVAVSQPPPPPESSGKLGRQQELLLSHTGAAGRSMLSSLRLPSLNLALRSSGQLTTQSQRHVLEQEDRIFAQHMQLFLILTYLVLPSVSRTQFRFLDCIDIHKEKFLKADTSIDCSDNEGYKQYVVLDCAFILVYQAIPLLWLYMLLRVKHLLVNTASVNSKLQLTSEGMGVVMADPSATAGGKTVPSSGDDGDDGDDEGTKQQPKNAIGLTAMPFPLPPPSSMPFNEEDPVPEQDPKMRDSAIDALDDDDDDDDTHFGLEQQQQQPGNNKPSLSSTETPGMTTTSASDDSLQTATTGGLSEDAVEQFNQRQPPRRPSPRMSPPSSPPGTVSSRKRQQQRRVGSEDSVSAARGDTSPISAGPHGVRGPRPSNTSSMTSSNTSPTTSRGRLTAGGVGLAGARQRPRQGRSVSQQGQLTSSAKKNNNNTDGKRPEGRGLVRRASDSDSQMLRKAAQQAIRENNGDGDGWAPVSSGDAEGVKRAAAAGGLVLTNYANPIDSATLKVPDKRLSNTSSQGSSPRPAVSEVSDDTSSVDPSPRPGRPTKGDLDPRLQPYLPPSEEAVGMAKYGDGVTASSSLQRPREGYHSRYMVDAYDGFLPDGTNTNSTMLDNRLKPLRFLFFDYQRDRWYFEVVEMYRRMLMISLLPFMGKPASRAFCGIALSIFSIILYRETMPFKSEKVNRLAVLAQYAILVTFVGALVVEAGSLPFSSLGLGLILIFTNLFIVAMGALLGLDRYRRQKREAERKQQELINQMAHTSFEADIIRRIMDGGSSSVTLMARTAARSQLASVAEEDGSEETPPVSKVGSGDGPPPTGANPRSSKDKSWFNREKRRERDRKKQAEEDGKLLNEVSVDIKDLKKGRRVGSGSFGDVFFGIYMGQPVAIKTVREITEDSMLAFRKEIILTSVLRHPNVVNLLGACWGRELTAMVLEWVAGGTLQEMLDMDARRYREEMLSLTGPGAGKGKQAGFSTNRISWEHPLHHVAVGSARAMVFLHGRRWFDELTAEWKECIIHRDLKPGNIMLTHEFDAKVGDFGMSRSVNREAVMTAVGTPLYAAPELMLGNQYDEKCDVYSFGNILLDMSIPENLLEYLQSEFMHTFYKNSDDTRYNKPGWTKVLNRMVDGWRPRLLASNPRSINQLIRDCTQQDPKKRPDFKEILRRLTDEVLKDVQATSSDLTKIKSPRARSGNYMQRNPSQHLQPQDESKMRPPQPNHKATNSGWERVGSIDLEDPKQKPQTRKLSS